MVLPVDVPEVGAIQVRVDLGGRDVGMPQELLHCGQIGAALHEVGRERVPERVR